MKIQHTIAIVCFLVLHLHPAFAQDSLLKMDYSNGQVVFPVSAESARLYLKGKYKEQLKSSDLILDYERKSIGACHFNFFQTFGGIKIHDAEIKISMDKSGKVIVVSDNLNKQGIDAQTQISKSIPKVVIESALKVWKEEDVLIWKNNSLTLAKKLWANTKNGIGHELIFDENGLYRDRVISCFFAQDSSVTALVFDPDPLTTAAVVYGGNFRDFNDGDSALVINAQRKQRSFNANFNGSVFELKNNFIELQDLDGDGTAIVTSPTNSFNFTRNQSGFEDANTFYHLSTLQKNIESSGFLSSSSKVNIDPHGGSFDNSYFTVPASLYFGTGGVDDAEDADVIVHEYTHFISYNAAPGSNTGAERNAIDEGTSDYIAASYSKAINSFNWQWVYNWDGHNEFWNGRVVSTSKIYPANKVGNLYKDGEMWSSTLMEIYDELGRATTDSLVFETMYQFVPNMTFEMAANALLKADTLLFNGRYFCTIYKHLLYRGFLTFRQNNCGISSIIEVENKPVEMIYTPYGFVIRDMTSSIKVNSINLYDVQGKLVRNIDGEIFSEKYEISSGIYIVEVHTNQGEYSLKWANY